MNRLYKLNLEIAERLEKTLGLKHVKTFEFKAGVDMVPYIRVEYFPEVDGAQALLSVIEDYKLVRIEKEEERT